MSTHPDLYIRQRGAETHVRATGHAYRLVPVRSIHQRYVVTELGVPLFNGDYASCLDYCANKC